MACYGKKEEMIMSDIKIGSHIIGNGRPAYIVAEVGINHNGDMELARKSILAAKQAGADAVKFQNYKADDFVPVRNVEYEYISQGKKIKEFQYDMFKRYELSDQDVIDLKKFCDQNNVDFHSTPSNKQGVDLLKKIGVGVLKNGSDYLTNLELIRYMAATGLPTVLSTGMASVAEIDDAARAFREMNNDQLILLHCTSRYPTPPADIHLHKIKTLRDTFDVLAGFSDHSDGAWAASASAAFGAVWIEKHFTLDKTLPGPDHWFSSSPEELAILVQGVRFIEASLGQPALGFTDCEKASRQNYRLSCCAAKDLATGHELTANDILFFRPGYGVPPKNISYLLGRKLASPLTKGEVILPEALE